MRDANVAGQHRAGVIGRHRAGVIRRHRAGVIGRHRPGVRGRYRLSAAVASATLALTLAALLTSAAELRTQSLAPGVYFGWTDGHTGLFQVPGRPCQGQYPGSDALVDVYLRSESLPGEFRASSATVTVPLSFAAEVPVLAFDPSALWARTPDPPREPAAATDLVEERLTRITVHCRSYAQASARLGSASFARVPPTRHATTTDPTVDSPAITVTPRQVPPAADLLGVLVISNDASTALTLRTLRFAPRGAQTGSVLAAAGGREHVAAWLDAVVGRDAARRLAGTVDPVALSPWDAAYQDPRDPRGLRPRDSEALDLVLQPGDMAVVAVTRDALGRTLEPRQVLLYPVLGYSFGAGNVAGSELLWQGLMTPLFGTTWAWL